MMVHDTVEDILASNFSLADVVSALAREIFSVDIDKIKILNLSENPHSVFLIIGVRKDDYKKYCVKIIRNKYWRDTDQIRMYVESETINLTNAFDCAIEGVSSPEIIGVLVDCNAIIMKYVEGKSFFNHIWSKSCFPISLYSGKCLERKSSNIAKWINKYQVATEQANDCKIIILKDLIDQCVEKARQCSTHISCFENVVKNIQILQSKDYINSVSNWKVCRCHNDFSPINIIVDRDGSISIIDFAFSGINFSYSDIASYWYLLEVIKNISPLRRRTVTKMQHSFLTSLNDCIDKRSDLFNIFILKYSLATVLGWHLYFKHDINVFTKIIQYRMYIERLNWLIRSYGK